MICARLLQPTTIVKGLKYSLGFFILYDFAFYCGYSIKGDYPDYVIISLQYFWFCTMNFSLKWDVLWVKMLKMAALLLVGVGYVVGFLGAIIIFMLASFDMESNRQWHITKDGKSYEIRGYSNGGWVGSMYTYYTFDAYKKLGPLEYRLISKRISDGESKLNFTGDLQFSLVDSTKMQFFVVTDDKGVRLTSPTR